MPIRLIAAVVVGLALAGLPPDLRAQKAAPNSFQRIWYQAYDEGVRAVQRGDWPTAIENLEAAKRSGPAPGRRVLFQGDRIDVFNPDYYLGLAYNATKRFKEAEAAFLRVANDKLVVPGDKLYETLRTQTAAAAYEGTVADANRALAAGRYDEVEKVVARVIGTPTDDGRAGELAKRAKDEVAKLSAAARDTKAPANDAPVLDSKVADTKAPDTRVPDPKEPDPKVPDLKVPDKAPDSKVADKDPVRPVPPSGSRGGTLPLTDQEAALLGATAYFQGNYEEAVRILTPAFEAAPPEFRVTFYLACSKAALVASGRADRSTLTEAREMFNYARGGRDLSAHLRLISPRVREMLGDVPATAR